MATIPEMLAEAVKHHQARQFHHAERLYRQILQDDPNHAEAMHLLGMIASEAGRHDLAIQYITRAIELDPWNPTFTNNLGTTYESMGEHERAALAFEQSLRVKPSYAEALSNLGSVRKAQGRLDDAVACFQKALRYKPDFAPAYSNLGLTLQDQGKTDEALAAYHHALNINPNLAQVHYDMGVIYQGLGRLEEQIASFREALRLRPNYPEALNNLGIAYQQQGNNEAAFASFREAIRIKPSHLAAWNNLGGMQQREGKLEEAAVSFERAISMEPNFAQAHANLGSVYKDLGRIAEAQARFREAYRIQPTTKLRVALGTLLPQIYQSLEEVQTWRQQLIDNIRQMRAENVKHDLTNDVAPPLFYLAYHGLNDRDINHDVTRLYSAPQIMDGARPASRSGDKIKLGLLSAYFKNHTIGGLNQGLFATLSRADFEVTALSVGWGNDLTANAIRQTADRFVVLPDNIQAARRAIAEEHLDVLHYADIGMDLMTYSLAFTRLAPVQTVTWGHPVTSGIDTMDYFISSEHLDTEDAQQYYTEKLVRLRDLAIYYYKPTLPPPLRGRDYFGLPEGKHLYACPQTLFKFHPDFDPILGEILRRDPLGMLVLVQGRSPIWEDRLLLRFSKTIPDVVNRVRFVPPQDRASFWNLGAIVDVLLDPVHFGGGNTSYEGFAFGTPIVSLPSPFLRGRITYALYLKMNVLDCIVGNTEEYVNCALKLGTDRDYRESIRAKILAANGILYENLSGVRELEAFFKEALANAAR